MGTIARLETDLNLKQEEIEDFKAGIGRSGGVVGAGFSRPTLSPWISAA